MPEVQAVTNILYNSYDSVVGGIKTVVSNSTDVIVDVLWSEKLNSVTIASQMLVGDETVALAAGHNVVVGNWLEFWEGPAREQAEVISVVANDIGIAMPIGFPFSVNATVNRVNVDMNVNGSVTPRFFTIAPLGTKPFRIIRTIVKMVHAAAADDSKFGGIAAITNGVFFRQCQVIPGLGTIYGNLFNAKNNGDFSIRAYDVVYTDKAGGGLFGTTVRRTFGGLDKNNVEIVVDGTNTIEAIVRDNLTTLSSFRVALQGKEMV